MTRGGSDAIGGALTGPPGHTVSLVVSVPGDLKSPVC